MKLTGHSPPPNTAEQEERKRMDLRTKQPMTSTGAILLVNNYILSARYVPGPV